MAVTTTLVRAHCPKCGNVKAIYIRACQDLVCLDCADSCRETPDAPPSIAPPSRPVSGPRRLLRFMREAWHSPGSRRIP